MKILDTNAPVVWIGKLNGEDYLLVSMRSIVEQRDGNVSIHFGKGEIIAAHLDLKNESADVIWNVSAGVDRIFSYPLLITNSIFAAVENDPNEFNGTAEIVKISRHGITDKIATVNYFVFGIYSFGKGFLVTGYDPSENTGRAMAVAAKTDFEQSGGDRIYSGYVTDVNGDGRRDVITARVYYGNHTSKVSIYVNRSAGFYKLSDLKIPGTVWEFLPFEIEGRERIAVSGSKGIYLLSFNTAKIFGLYSTTANCTISPADVGDINGDGNDEFFVLMNNGTQNFIVGLKYVGNKLEPFVKYKLDLNAFPVKVARNYILIGAEDGLYCMKLT